MTFRDLDWLGPLALLALAVLLDRFGPRCVRGGLRDLIAPDWRDGPSGPPDPEG